MSKIIKKIFFTTAIMLCLSLTLEARAFGRMSALSDSEMDGVSAGGLNINMDALASYQSILLSQNNVAGLAGAGIIDSSINNYNSAVTGLIGGQSAAIRQENVAAVVASGGDITGAVINNSNYGRMSGSSSEAGQSNIAALIAVNGNVYDSEVNNTNELVLAGQMQSANVNQSNVIVVVANDLFNTVLNNTNTITDAAGDSLAGGVSQDIHTFSYNGMTATIRATSPSEVSPVSSINSNILITITSAAGTLRLN